ncbi:MAG: tetratricopeptide repeat protein [Acidobacteria bacterium]|nr:tetratricopeptide repeat protein [Acidobacteriota bacterium]
MTAAPKPARYRSAFPRVVLIVAVLAAIGGAWYLLPRAHWGQSQPPRPSDPGVGSDPAALATFVGEPACTKCHETQTKEWRASDHFRAMEVATGETVLGDFNNTTFAYAGITSSFSRRNGKFFVRTDGPDGALHDYEITYTFGYRPLQQYLIEFPGGRMQCLPIAWDTRPKAQGGQRWFHLYPDQRVTHLDPLHWTGPNQNWNYMCADCHSTNLRRNYDLPTNTYKTTWSEINVSCETCHGPGSAHVAWAEERKKRGLSGRDSTAMGLLVQGLRAIDYGGFGVGDATSATARLANRPRQRAEIQACAPCHARRGPITDVPDSGKTFLDSYRPAMLEDGLYYADGQILDEVYEYASFTQSKMYAAGVTCSDCHNAHSLKQRGTGNNVCGHCHLPLTYDTPAHHHHKQGTDAARCRNCHMRTTDYMVVDPRYDHSMRVPRVDYSIAYGIPNACTTPCHKDKGFTWANDAVVKWYGPVRTRGNDYVVALDAARKGLPDAEAALRAVVLNPKYSGIARATALQHLRDVAVPASIEALHAGATDPDAIVRAEAARALEVLPPADRVRLGRPLLTDPVRLVRAWAAMTLAGTPADLLTASETADLERATREEIALELAVAERPEAHLNLSNLYQRQGKAGEAEAELRTALRLDPRNIPARVNLADLYRTSAREADAERVLTEALQIDPNVAEVRHALGLLFIRVGRRDEAMAHLKRAHELLPSNARYGYVYAVGLNDAGRAPEAVRLLADLQRTNPADRDILAALATIEQAGGHWSEAIGWAEKLVRIRPDDQEARTLLNQLKRQAAAARR